MVSRQSRRQFLLGSALGGVAALPGEATPQAALHGETPRAHILQMINGYRTAQMLHVAAKLRIADELAQGPRTVAQLAAATEYSCRFAIPAPAHSGRYGRLRRGARPPFPSDAIGRTPALGNHMKRDCDGWPRTRQSTLEIMRTLGRTREGL
jgi:hypothetical protein